MERHRDIRRGNMAASANGLSRRRPRSSASTTTTATTASNSFRDSPEDDGGVELQETTRLRDRAGKRERDRLNRNKRRRGERLMLGGHREDGGEESTEDSVDEDEDDEDDESGHIRMRPPNPNPASSSAHSNHHLHRKSFPPAATAKVLRTSTWKVSDEMSFSVPKKARSACIKRTHESYVSVGGGGGGGVGGSGEQLHRQASTSPARPSPAPTPAPASPSSSTASIRKKMKPIGAKPKHKPPKPSLVQDDIEIEVAEVLYGLMRQYQCPSRQESVANSSPKLDSRDANGSIYDAKSSIVSSPNSAPPTQSKLPPNSCSTTTPVSAVAPKRKRPRPVKFDEENSPILSSNKIDGELPMKTEASSSKLHRNSGSNESRSGVALDFGNSQINVPMDVQQEMKTEINLITESKPVGEESVVRADDQTDNNNITSPKKESSCSKVDLNSENATATKASTSSVSESHREENFKIDLMAPPSKSSPERDGEIGFISDSKPVASDSEMKLESAELKENVDINCNKDMEAVVRFEKKTEVATVDECESQKPIVQKHTMLDLQTDPAKDNKESGPSGVRQQQQQQLQLLQQQSKAIRNDPKLEIAAQSSVPLPMGVTGWPGGLTPMGNSMGQIRPIQGMASLDGTPGSSNAIQPPHHPPTQPWTKRCATHYVIARNIYCQQQYTKIGPFWSAAAGSASLYGNKPYNLNVMPPTETTIIGNPLSGNFAGKNLSSMQDRGQTEAAKDKSSVAANFMDSSQGKVVPKQMVLQQPPQQPAIQGPTLIFPMNQQQVAVASGNKNAAAKASNTGNAAPSITAQSAAGAPGNLSASVAGPATMSFNYPNLAGGEAQYVAILQNSGYQFPVPTHVGAASSYRGTAPPAMPFYNGQFYSSQMMQMQQQQMQQSHSQQQQQQPNQQGHQNTSTSSGSSSSQKHQQHNHHQRLPGSGSNTASGTSNNFPANKNRQQKQQNQSFPVAHQVRHHDTDMAVESGPSQEDNRISLAHKNTYSHNFAMPVHAKNFGSVSAAALASGTGNHSDRQPQQQHQSSKGAADSNTNQTFAMPFTSFNGGAAISGLDFSSMAQNHVIFQSLPDAARHGYPIAAAVAHTTQQKKNHHILEEGKVVSDSNNGEDERKAPAGKGQPSGAQAIVFSRADSADPSVSTMLGNSVVESSARTLNLISSPSTGNRNSRPNTSTSAAPNATTVNASYSQQQQQQQQQQQKQMGQLIQMQQLQQMQLMRQQQMHQQIAAAAAARGKPSATNSTSVYTDSLSSTSSMAAKFSNTHYYPEALIQGGSSTQSPQWKNTRTAASSSSSPNLASATSSLKNLPQQQGRPQQGHTQISFGVNSKSGSAQHGQQISTGNQSPSSAVVVGSPPTSISKSAGGSPRASSTGNKMVSAPSLSSQQQAKTSSSGPSRKSSPVGGRNVPSNLGNSHITPAPCSTTKSSQSHHQQALHQQQQQQQQKQTLHQAQLYFSNAYMQAQSPQSNSSTANNTGAPNSVYYQQRRQPPEQQQQQLASNTPGMLTLCPLTLASTTTDPTKAVAAATAASMKGGLPPPGLIHAAQFATQPGGHPYMSTTFPYIHSVPPVQVKSGEQKQPAGNDNVHT